MSNRNVLAKAGRPRPGAAGLFGPARAREIGQGLCEDLRRLSGIETRARLSRRHPTCIAADRSKFRPHRPGHGLAASEFGHAADALYGFNLPVGAGAAIRFLTNPPALAPASPDDRRATIRRPCAARRMETDGNPAIDAVAAAGAACKPRMTSSGPVSARSRPKRPIWLRSERIEWPMPQRSANFVNVAGLAGPARPTMTGRLMPRASSSPIHPRIGALSKQNCVTTSTWILDLMTPVPPCFEPLNGSIRLPNKGGLRDDRQRLTWNAARLDQSAGANIEARLERAFCGRDVAGNQKYARNVRLAAQRAPGSRRALRATAFRARRHAARG